MPTELREGAWYVVADCAHCQSLIVLFRDLTNGASTLNATYYVVCPNCGQEGAYLARHYRHETDKSPSVEVK